jgi:hypothetical protein
MKHLELDLEAAILAGQTPREFVSLVPFSAAINCVFEEKKARAPKSRGSDDKVRTIPFHELTRL